MYESHVYTIDGENKLTNKNRVTKIPLDRVTLRSVAWTIYMTSKVEMAWYNLPLYQVSFPDAHEDTVFCLLYSAPVLKSAEATSGWK